MTRDERYEELLSLLSDLECRVECLENEVESLVEELESPHENDLEQSDLETPELEDFIDYEDGQ